MQASFPGEIYNCFCGIKGLTGGKSHYGENYMSVQISNVLFAVYKIKEPKAKTVVVNENKWNIADGAVKIIKDKFEDQKTQDIIIDTANKGLEEGLEAD